MNAILKFNAESFTEEVLRLILAAAQERNCSPQAALELLLIDLAKDQGFPPRTKAA
jgi:hypothetical protein